MKPSALLSLAITLLIVNQAFGEDIHLQDFAEGIVLNTGSQPLQELSIPDQVYAKATQWNLADVRVFNTNGEAIPHAFCSSTTAEKISGVASVPVFSIDATRPDQATHSNITLHTPEGVSLTVESGADKQSYPYRNNASYVLDLRKVDHDVNALKLNWSLPAGTSETTLSVLGSNDLSHWQLITSSGKLLRAVADQRVLELSRIEFSPQHYEYLRIEPSTNTLTINGAEVEYSSQIIKQVPVWYSAGAPHGSEDPHELHYQNSRRVPVTLLRITPHVENSSTHVTVQSRDRDDHPWQTQWTGEVFDVHFNNQNRRNDDISISSTAAREWRLLFDDNNEPPASVPSFEMGYIPARLRFVAQGSGPFTLAYGNARVTTPTARYCDDLLASVNTSDKQQMMGTATTGATQLLAGKEALAIKKKIPTRTLILWLVLLTGAAIIMKMALTMLKSGKHKEGE